MSTVIIGIHGMGNKPPKEILTQWWISAIREGLLRIGKAGSTFPFEMVYWADVLHPRPLDPKVTNKNDPLFLDEPYLPATLPSPVAKVNRIREKLVRYIHEQMDKLILNPDLSISFSTVSDLVLRYFFRDVGIYFSAPCMDPKRPECGARKVIQDRLAAVLQAHRKDRIMLISHSMGTIVAYETLFRPGLDVSIDMFITMGSPLGIPIIKRKISEENKRQGIDNPALRTPGCIVKNWLNFSDPEDRIALNCLLFNDYLPNIKDIRPKDMSVHADYSVNGEQNHHKSYGYLRTPEAALAVSRFIDSGKPWIIRSFRRLFGFASTKSA